MTRFPDARTLGFYRVSFGRFRTSMQLPTSRPKRLLVQVTHLSIKNEKSTSESFLGWYMDTFPVLEDDPFQICGCCVAAVTIRCFATSIVAFPSHTVMNNAVHVFGGFLLYL